RPGLGAGPFDGVVVVLGFLHTEGRLQAWALADAARIHPDADVALRYPHRSVDGLVVLILGAIRIAGEITVLHLLLADGVGLVDKVHGATLAHGHRRRAEVDRHGADELMHSGRNLDARLDVAVLIERMDESTQVGYRRVVELVDLSGYTVCELRQIQARRRFHRPQHHPADQKRNGLSFAVLEFAIFRSDA